MNGLLPCTCLGKPWGLWSWLNPFSENGKAESSRTDHYKQPQESIAKDPVQITGWERPADEESTNETSGQDHTALCYCGRNLVSVDSMWAAFCLHRWQNLGFVCFSTLSITWGVSHRNIISRMHEVIKFFSGDFISLIHMVFSLPFPLSLFPSLFSSHPIPPVSPFLPHKYNKGICPSKAGNSTHPK